MHEVTLGQNVTAFCNATARSMPASRGAPIRSSGALAVPRSATA